LRPSNANRLYTDEKSIEIGEIKHRNHRKVQERKIGKQRGRKDCAATLLLCLTSILQPVRLGRPYQEYKTPVSIAIRVIEVRNPPYPLPTKR